MLKSYSHGVVTEEYLYCSDPTIDVNHGVVLVGYGLSNQNDFWFNKCKEYWVIRNSWSAHWGEDGFFRLCMDGAGTKEFPLGTCLINSFAAWPTMN